MDEAALDRIAEAAWDLRCQRMAEAEDGPKFIPGTWAARPEHLKETDRSVVSLVAAEAVADAKVRNERLEVQVFALAAHLPAIRRALTLAATEAEYEAEAKQYRAAIQALGISEEGERHA